MAFKQRLGISQKKKYFIFMLNVLFVYYGFRFLTFTAVKMENDVFVEPKYYGLNISTVNLKDRIQYVIKNEHFCDNLKDLKYIIYVHTAPSHKLQRSNLRKTWANKDLFLDHRTNVMFFMGKSDDHIQEDIMKESDMYGDIVQGDFLDTYRNLTLKGILGLQWLSNYCTNIQYAIKADDDAFVNIFQLIEILEEHQSDKKVIVCPHWGKNTMHVMRDPKVCDKWCIKDSEMAGRVYYPPYCSGITFTLSKELIPEMYRVSFNVPFFWVDDVYISGLLTEKIPGVHFVDVMKRFRADENAAWDIIKDLSKPLMYYISHVRKSEHFPMFWKNALERLTQDEINKIHPLVYSTLSGKKFEVIK